MWGKMPHGNPLTHAIWFKQHNNPAIYGWEDTKLSPHQKLLHAKAAIYNLDCLIKWTDNATYS